MTRALRPYWRLAWLLLLLGACAPAQPTRPALPRGVLTAAGLQLLADGQPFVVHGINYIRPTGADPATCAALQFGADSHCPWAIAPIAADMERLARQGVNTVRVFLDYYVFGGARAGDPHYDINRPLANLDAFIASANQRGIYVLPVLLAKYPQDHFDPASYETALDLHVRPVVRHLAGRPGILAWDLFNEPDLGGPVDARCWDWDNGAFAGCLPLANQRLHFIQTIHAEVKRLDPDHLTTVSLGFAKNYFRPLQADLRMADLVDVYAFHYYDNDPYNSGRYAAHWYYGKGFPDDQRQAISELQALPQARPIIISELGFPSETGSKRTLAEVQRDLHTALQVSTDAHISGMIVWPFQPEPQALLGDLFTK